MTSSPTAIQHSPSSTTSSRRLPPSTWMLASQVRYVIRELQNKTCNKLCRHCRTHLTQTSRNRSSTVCCGFFGGGRNALIAPHSVCPAWQTPPATTAGRRTAPYNQKKRRNDHKCTDDHPHHHHNGSGDVDSSNMTDIYSRSSTLEQLRKTCTMIFQHQQ